MTSRHMRPPIIDDGTYNPILRRHVRHWRAIGPFRSARFDFPKFRCGYFEIISPSLVTPGHWRVSRFDELGAIGHTERPTAQEAIEALEVGGVLVQVIT